MLTTDINVEWTVPYDDASTCLVTAHAPIDAYNVLKVFFDPVPGQDSMVIIAFDIINSDAAHTDVSPFEFTNVIFKTVEKYLLNVNPCRKIIFPCSTSSRYKLLKRLSDPDKIVTGYQLGPDDLVDSNLKSRLINPHYQIISWIKPNDNN